MVALNANDWDGSGRRSRRFRFKWSTLLWALVYPRRREKTVPTTSGTVLIALSFGIGSAAYNAANNILFIALSLMLSCLILSGVLAWLNFRRVAWRLRPPQSFRAGHETLVPLDVRNGKRVLPTYGLWFSIAAKPDGREPVPPFGDSKPVEGRAPARPSPSVRETLARSGKDLIRGKLFQRGRLDPDSEMRLEWTYKPTRRGRHQLAVEWIGSLFPFGFLEKSVMADSRREIVVWPAPVVYRRINAGSLQAQPAGTRSTATGASGDLVALRKYEPGDSHSVIHWKASARVRELLVRQFASESQETFSLWLQSSADLWPRPEQFELAVGFAASLAEDLFRGGRLRSVAVGEGEPDPVRRARDLDAFLDKLAVVQVSPGDAAPARTAARGRNLITFAPEGARGVVARADGRPIAAV